MNYRAQEMARWTFGVAGDPRAIPGRGRRRQSPSVCSTPTPIRRTKLRGRRNRRQSGRTSGRGLAPDHPRMARIRAHQHHRAVRLCAADRRAISAIGSNQRLKAEASRPALHHAVELRRRFAGSNEAIPITMVKSGPASGVWGAAELGRLIGEPNVLAFDIGGTTAKCSLIERRGADQDRLLDRARPPIAGYPIMVPVVDLVEIGNGGGSIAWVDDVGKLHVGPQSAGACPGPRPTAAAARGHDNRCQSRPRPHQSRIFLRR